MGFSNWSDDTYNSLSKGYVGKSADEIFSDKEDKDMSPVELDIRESRDSDDHPESLAVMVCLDETGSMGRIPETIAREKLGALMSTIIDNSVKDPQILFAGIGDHVTDRSPLQVGQFESGPEELDKWLSSIFLEGFIGILKISLDIGCTKKSISVFIHSEFSPSNTITKSPGSIILFVISNSINDSELQ